MSAMADLYTALEDLAQGRDLDLGQINLVQVYLEDMAVRVAAANRPPVVVEPLPEWAIDTFGLLKEKD